MLPSFRKFTIWQLLLALGVLGLAGFILVPVIRPVRESGGPPSCRSRARQISAALMMYLSDYNDRLPPIGSGQRAVTLPQLLWPYTKTATIWRCPQGRKDRPPLDLVRSPGDPPVDYGYNWLTLSTKGKGIALDEVKEPALTVALVDAEGLRAAPTPIAATHGASPPVPRHKGQVTVVWLDGHVKLMALAELEEAPGQEAGARLSPGIDAYRYWKVR